MDAPTNFMTDASDIAITLILQQYTNAFKWLRQVQQSIPRLPAVKVGEKWEKSGPPGIGTHVGKGFDEVLHRLSFTYAY